MRYLSAQSKPVKFLSYDGVWKGTDIDDEIVFTDGGHAQLTSFMDAVFTFKGTYTVDDHGAIRLSLRHHAGKWPPVMYLYKDQRGAFLLPGGQAQNDSEWPFRQIK